MNHEIDKWKLLNEEPMGDYRIFRTYRLHMENPYGKIGDFYRLDSPDWVTVIPRSEEGKYLLVRQFRIGSQQLSLEFPAGVVEEGENPQITAQRELKEETGFTAETIRKVGEINPNPAFMSNCCHTFEALGLKDHGETQWDDHESLESLWMTEKEIDRAIDHGEIYSAIMIQAWFWHKKRES